MQMREESSKYPNLELVITLYKVLAVICLLGGVIVAIIGIITIDSGGGVLILGGIIAGGLGAVSCFACAEILRLFINMDSNTAKIAYYLGNDRDSYKKGQPSQICPQNVTQKLEADLRNDEETEIGFFKDLMVWIEPGDFTMGSPERRVEGGILGIGGKEIEKGEEDRLINEGPQTQVSLTGGFWLGKHPVTQGQWQALMGNNPSHFTNSGLNAPVERVSWNDAMDFARRLTEQERRAGRLPDGYVYTLPSEAQWEYAARAGTTTRFYTGNSDSDLGRAGWFSGNAGGSTKPVGQKVANARGLYDMHGNVWEWTRTWFGNYPGGSVVDYEGPASGSYRVRRGGSWISDAGGCRSAYRDYSTPTVTYYSIGFRLALSSVP